MSKNLLDPRDYKHVKSDENSTTLQHKRGHIVTIAHNAVSPKNREMLKSLADRPSDNSPQYGQVVKKFDGGGQVPAPGQPSSSAPPPPQPISKNEVDSVGGMSGAWNNAKKELGFAAGGMTSTDGNKVPAPNGAGVDTNKEQVAHDLGKPSRGEPSNTDEPATLFNPSKMWENIKNGMARGGEVKMAGGGNVENNAPGATSSGAYDAGLPCLNPHCKSHGKPHPNCRCYANMAEGGEVFKVRYCAHGKPHMESCEYSKPKMKGLAEGGRVMYAEAGEVEPDDDDSYRHQRSGKNASEHYSEAARLAEKAGDSMNNQSPDQVAQPSNGNDNAQQIAPQQAPQPIPQSQPVQQQAPQGQSPAAQQPQQPMDSAAPQAPQDQTQQPQQQQPQTPQMSPGAQEYLRENAAWVQDLNNGHITPKTYNDLMYHNKDGTEKTTLGKIGTIFGMLVGGAGSALAHQPNMAMQMMDNVIKNDLDAQTKSKDNAQNYLRVEQARLLNNANVINVLQSADYTEAQKAALLQGIQMKSYTNTYMKLNSVALHDQMEKLKKLQPGTTEYQQAAQVALMMSEAVDKNNAQAAVLGAAGVDSLGNYGLENQQGLPGQPQGQIDPEQQFKNRMQIMELAGQKDKADSLRRRHLPGVPGFATDDLDKATKDKFTSRALLDDKVRDVLDFARKNAGSQYPSVIQRGAQKAAELARFYNKSVDSLGMTAGRMDWIGQQIKENPQSILQQILGNNARLEEIRDSNTHQRDIELNKLGFPVHPKSANQPEYKTYNGKKYMRGPNGKPVEVK